MSKIVNTFLTLYEAEKDYVKRFRLLNDFINIYYDSNFTKVNFLLERELQFCLQHKLIDGEALIRFMLSYSNFEAGKLKEGEEELKKVMAIFDQVKSHEVRSQVYNFLAYIHSHQGNFEEAFKNVYECIRESEQAEYPKNRYWGIYTLGVFHYDLKDFSLSEKYYQEAAQKFKEAGNPYGVARSETGLSSVYIQQGKLNEAEQLLQHSLQYYKEVEVLSGQSRSLNDLGLIARKKGELEKALAYFKESLAIRTETNHKQGIATSLNEIAEVLIDLKKYREAETYLHRAKTVCEEVKNRSKLYRAHLLFSQVYRNLNEPWKALEHFEQYDKIKSEVLGETANNKIKELQTRMATQKSEKEAEIHRLKNVELKKAYEEIEMKNKDILDSIRYARKIQQSLMPTEIYIRNTLLRLKTKS